jgi:regulatory protein
MRKTTANSKTANERQQSITQICLRLLARREHSRRELMDKLALRGFNRQEVEPVLTQLADENWQNDERYAQCYARHRLENGYGPLRIAYELQQRGIESIDLDALIAGQESDWQQHLLNVYLDKYTAEPELSAEIWLKRSRFLQQRGFSGDMIKKLFAELKIKLQR